MTAASPADIGNNNISVLGTVTTGVWNASVITPPFGGTGVANAVGSTITLAGPLVTSGANSLTLTTTGPTNVTFPTSGTLATTGATAGSLIFLTSATAASSATLVFTALFSATYNSYVFLFENIVPASTNTILYCQMGFGAGPTYVTTGYNWNNSCFVSTSSLITFAASDTQALLTNNSGSFLLPTTAGAGYCGRLTICGTNGSASFVNGYSQGVFMTAAVDVANNMSTFYLPTSNTYTSIKFYMSSGNIASGKISVYGIANS
jgi:hypothetical protein